MILRESRRTAAPFYRQAGRVGYLIRMRIGSVFSFAPSSAWFNAVDKVARYNGKTDLYGFPTGREHYFGEIFPRETLFPPAYVDFCDIKAPVFHDYDTYLRNLYGDYMQIPGPGERERHYYIDIEFDEPCRAEVSHKT